MLCVVIGCMVFVLMGVKETKPGRTITVAAWLVSTVLLVLVLCNLLGAVSYWESGAPPWLTGITVLAGLCFLVVYIGVLRACLRDDSWPFKKGEEG